MKEFRGRVAVVTGAASGIGFALCQRFAAEGMHLVMADLPDSPLDSAATKLRAEFSAAGGEVLTQPTDVARWDDVAALAAATKAKFGGAHIVCNNAGVRTMGSIWNVSLEDWHWVIGINLWGVIHGIKAFAPEMIARGEPGHFVNTASTVGLVAMPDNGPYSASKFGVVGVSESLLDELRLAGAPIGVTVLCPNRVPTQIRQNSNRRRPSGEPVSTHQSGDAARAVQAPGVAAMVLDAIRLDRFWLLTHPEFGDELYSRTRNIVESNPAPPRA
ncbi:MAG: SDR family NAD(P)-dependent oxidoreductase [Betaproteobacteria bacterium]|nr:SDR family NAD(P)-dependent oxidoreductase [Betaproteobacteria bacterium]